MQRRMKPANRISVAAMCAALTVLALFAAAVTPYGTIALCFLASAFIYVLAAEGEYLFCILVYIASGALSFLISPSKLPAAAYIALLGHFGIFKAFIETKVHDRLLAAVVCLLYCNAFAAASVWAAFALLSVNILGYLPALPVWLLVVIAEGALAAYYLLYSAAQKIYMTRLRHVIISSVR